MRGGPGPSACQVLGSASGIERHKAMRSRPPSRLAADPEPLKKREGSERDFADKLCLRFM